MSILRKGALVAIAAAFVPGFVGLASADGGSAGQGGAYAGIRLGHGWHDATARVGAVEEDYDAKGGFLGVLVGYDQALQGPWSVGATLDFSAGNERGSLELAGPVIFKIKQEWEATLRGRVAYALQGFTPYATAGLTYGSFETQYSQVGLPFAVRDTGELGWTIGAGVEVPLQDRLSLVAEYRYTDYGDDVDAFGVIDGPYAVNSQKIHLGLNWKL